MRARFVHNCSGGVRPPKENEPGAHRAPLQEDKSVVAAVYDRREEEGETGAHRDAATEQPLQKLRLRRLDRVFVDSSIYFITACSFCR